MGAGFLQALHQGPRAENHHLAGAVYQPLVQLRSNGTPAGEQFSPLAAGMRVAP